MPDLMLTEPFDARIFRNQIAIIGFFSYALVIIYFIYSNCDISIK